MTPPSSVTRKPSCFFKIILENTIREGKLRIPSKFLKYYGNCLSSPIILKDPTGTSWKVELLKNVNEVWLGKGWPEFSENHTLKHGHLVLFQYQRDGHFHVFIFDESAVETEYSSSRLHSGTPNFNGESPQPNKQEVDDQDDISCGNHSKGKRKRFKDEKGISRQARRPKCSKTCGAHEAADSDFISSYPYFKVVLRQHHNVRVPISLIRGHMECESQTMMLKVAEKSWPVKLNVYLNRKLAMLSGGWRAFARENSLEAGDVCILELIERNVLNVNIFRCAPNFGGESPQPKKKETDDQDDISCDDPTRNGNQSKGIKLEVSCKLLIQSNKDPIKVPVNCFNVGKRKQFKDEKGISRQAGWPKCSKTCGAHEADNSFISSYPYFKVVLRQLQNAVWNL
ncbi:hypothetical protein P3X46_014218 [Hevea brasiliensis]|uniref:TF-B3 domain-containing protein n=1 Tax=Hevea brasiliensis TaxID=3981 RepID=A0ABQ9M9U6_HEVBR|nr:hypothetical protein P3X46_014218 [Hevea brasiliensis]